MSPSTRQLEFSPEQCHGKQKRQELFCNLKVQRDKATKSKLWNLIKSWMENKIYKWHFGVHWGHLTVDCVSIHIGDHKGLLFISLDVVMIFWVQWRRSLLSRDTSWSIMNEALWCFQLTSSVSEKIRERESQWGIQVESVYIFIVLYLTFVQIWNVSK